MEAYEITIIQSVCLYIRLCVPHKQLFNQLIDFVKFGMKVVPLKVTLTPKF
jgi:hypothetical protein